MKNDDVSFWEIVGFIVGLPIYSIGFLAGGAFIAVRGGWREAMKMIGDDADKAKYRGM
jgi:hypothetical protein